MDIDIKLPDIAGVNEVEIVEVLVNVGDLVKIEQTILMVEAQKASFDIPSPYNGIIKYIKVKISDIIKVGTVIFVIDDDVKNNLKLSSNFLQDVSHTGFSDKKSLIHDKEFDLIDKDKYFLNKHKYATPLIRRLVRKLGIDISTIQGSGRKGRILKSDLDRFLNTNSSEYVVNSKLDDNLIASKNRFNEFGKTKVSTINNIQKNIGKKLHQTWNMIPHVTQFDEIDITELEIFRRKENKILSNDKKDIKITPIVFLLKSISKCLKQMPNFNSSLSDDGNSLILKEYINIGVVVNSSYGLFIPVIYNVDKKNIIDLSIELSILSNKVRSNNLKKINFKGGSFTISSLGKMGGIFFTPIINYPEVAILGLSKMLIKPLWIIDKFVPRTILPFSLSYDHRVINGVEAGKFMNLINYFMSDIRRLII